MRPFSVRRQCILPGVQQASGRIDAQCSAFGLDPKMLPGGCQSVGPIHGKLLACNNVIVLSSGLAYDLEFSISSTGPWEEKSSQEVYGA